MVIVFSQVAILFIFIIAGYVLGRTKRVDSKNVGLLSALEVYVFLPCSVFRTFSSNFNTTYLGEKYSYVLISFCVLALVWGAAMIISPRLSDNKYQQNNYKYSMIAPNYGYMGYALAEGVLGSAGALNMMMFAIPIMLYTNIVGYSILTKRKLSPAKLLNPMVMAMIAGSIAGMAGVNVTGAAKTVLDKSSACMAPVSMLLTGIAISEFRILKFFTNVRLYIVAGLRLLIFPLAIGCALWYIFGNNVAIAALFVHAMPCGLNTIVYPKLVGEDCSIGAGLAVVSNILACITIPICLGLFL
ncbi:MAG: hypothetical protein E7473_08460 [Ruminococcaceae bacterium]|nr:hypothetical protein [Oscillospiraceae bacterium]